MPMLDLHHIFAMQKKALFFLLALCVLGWGFTPYGTIFAGIAVGAFFGTYNFWILVRRMERFDRAISEGTAVIRTEQKQSAYSEQSSTQHGRSASRTEPFPERMETQAGRQIHMVENHMYRKNSASQGNGKYEFEHQRTLPFRSAERKGRQSNARRVQGYVVKHHEYE